MQGHHAEAPGLQPHGRTEARAHRPRRARSAACSKSPATCRIAAGRTSPSSPAAYIVAPVNAQDLKSVILNLVVNALDSMDDGGRLAIYARTQRRATRKWSSLTPAAA